MEDIFREKGLIEGRYYFSGSPGFWEETSPKASVFFLGEEGVGAVNLTKDGRWRAYVYIPASLLIGKGSTEKSLHLTYSRTKVKAKKVVENFYRRLLK